jgi:hypothetical protein
LPFYFNQGKINLFALFINFLFLSFISLTLTPDLILNQVAFCMEEGFQSDNSVYNESTGSSSDYDVVNEGDDGDFVLNEDSINLNIEQEFDRILNKNLKYSNYVANSSKCFSNNYNYKIFKELNMEMFSVKLKIDLVTRTISSNSNPEILNIKVDNFTSILSDLQYYCYQTKYIFLKSYFDINQSNIYNERLNDWGNIFQKIPFFEKNLNNHLVTDLIFEFFYDSDILGFTKNNSKTINYLNFLKLKNDSVIMELSQIDDQETLLKDTPQKNICYSYTEDDNSNLIENSDLLSYYKESAIYLSENSENVPLDDLILGETHYLFPDRVDSLAQFKEHTRSKKEIVTLNDISMDQRNNDILIKNSVFWGKNFAKSYIIEKNFDINKPLINHNNYSLSDFLSKKFIEKNYLLENEEKENTLSTELVKKNVENVFLETTKKRKR